MELNRREKGSEKQYVVVQQNTRVWRLRKFKSSKDSLTIYQLAKEDGEEKFLGSCGISKLSNNLNWKLFLENSMYVYRLSNES